MKRAHDVLLFAQSALKKWSAIPVIPVARSWPGSEASDACNGHPLAAGHIEAGHEFLVLDQGAV